MEKIFILMAVLTFAFAVVYSVRKSTHKQWNFDTMIGVFFGILISLFVFMAFWFLQHQGW